MVLRLITTSVLGVAAVMACSSDDSGEEGSDKAGSSGAGATGGSSSGGTSADGTSTGGASTGGVGGGGTSSGGTGSSADGGQPIGALCANDTNCSQTQGATVCCSGECQLAADCPAGTPYLPCQVGSDCQAFGGGKICCEVSTGTSVTRFCTKQSGCMGNVIP